MKQDAGQAVVVKIQNLSQTRFCYLYYSLESLQRNKLALRRLFRDDHTSTDNEYYPELPGPAQKTFVELRLKENVNIL